MAAKQGKIVEIFFSYAHEDETWRNTLEKHLNNMKRQRLITGWNDRNISAGQEWAHEIDRRLQTARIILLLISADFMASDYCYSVEVKRAMERHHKGEARVIPIILRPCDRKGAPFEKLQALPTDAQPITSWRDQDEAFLNIVDGIRQAIEELNRRDNNGGSSSFPLWNISYVSNPYFTGREEVLKRPDAALRGGKTTPPTQTISGLGGTGQTQTAI